MNNSLLKIFLLSISLIFAGYIVAKGLTEDNADKKLIEKIPDKNFTAETLSQLSAHSFSNHFIESNVKTNIHKRVKVRRGTRRRIFIDLDNDGVADDRDL